MSRSHPLLARAVLIVAVGLTAAGGGCAAHRDAVNAVGVGKPPELQTLADLRPPMQLPTPTTQPLANPPIEALIEYAKGRDALLKDQKTVAIQHLKAAVELDATSSIVLRDLGYAQLGMDDARATAAFRQAVAVDPADADSRLQLARLLLSGKATGDKTSTDQSTDDAVTQLRLARRSPGYQNDNGLAAVVDLLLGQCLEQSHYRTAALECYEHVLAIVDERAFDLRGRPELVDVLTRPGILVLRTADLATQTGKFARAIELYQRLQQQEPQSAPSLELRLARAQLASGDRAGATSRAFDYIGRTNGSPLALESFIDLFDSYGGSKAALAELGTFRTDFKPEEAERLALLRSYLLLDIGDAGGAIESIRRVDTVTLPNVRQTIRAYRGAGREDELLVRLLEWTNANPGKWSTFERGWEMLTQLAQPKPLTPEHLQALKIDDKLRSARDYVASRLYLAMGRQKTAKSLLDASATPGPNAFDAAAAAVSPALQLSDTDDASSSTELAVLFDAYRDDPELLVATVADALRSGQKRLAFDALAAVNSQRPTDAAVAAAYAQILAADSQRASASAALDKAVTGATTAPELYYLASQYSLIGDDKAAERVLRLGYARDENLPSICNDLGYLLTDQGRDLPFAEKLLSKAATLEPDNAAYLDSLGWLLYKRAKFDESSQRLEEAVAAATPVDPVVLDHAGDALYQAKKPDKSAQRWQQAVDAIKARGTQDPQLRLKIEQKLRQLEQKSPVVVAPVAKAE